MRLDATAIASWVSSASSLRDDGIGSKLNRDLATSTRSLFEEINRHLESQGLRLREGTIVDASIIEAPSSTKNRAGDRDPEMRQTKKGNEWHFGMKVHIGADAETGVVHSVTTTPANVHDVTEAHRLLHGREKRVSRPCDATRTGR